MVNRWEWLISNATLDIVNFDIQVRESDFNDINRVYPFYLMSYVKDGYAEATYQGETHPHKPGHLLIMPPNLPHGHCVPLPGLKTTFLWWHFNLTIGGVVDFLRLINPRPTINAINTGTFESAFVQYVELYHKKPTIPNMLLKRAKGLEVMAHLLENMLNSVNEHDQTLPDVPDSFFEIFTQLVEHPEENLSLRELGDRYYMNATYISNRFKKLFGIAPIKLQHDLLIRRAKSLLAEGSKPITDIARELGFLDVSSFTRFFSKRVGISPSLYRDQA